MEAYSHPILWLGFTKWGRKNGCHFTFLNGLSWKEKKMFWLHFIELCSRWTNGQEVLTGSDSGVSQFNAKPLPEPMMTQFTDMLFMCIAIFQRGCKVLWWTPSASVILNIIRGVYSFWNSIGLFILHDKQISIRSSDNDNTSFWPPGSLHTLGADGHI